MRLVIVGNGVAGVTTARFVADRRLAAKNRTLQIAIYSKEPYLYYPRPRLIDLIAGKVSSAEMPQYPKEWYAERGIQTALRRRALALDPQRKALTFDDGSVVEYDKLVLAIGACPFVPPIPGADLPGVYTLRTMDDALALRHRAQTMDAAVILGGGLLGLDTAMALRAHGIAVTVVELLPWLLPRQLDAEGADILKQGVEKRGVKVLTNVACAHIESRPGRLCAHLQDGRTLEADLIVVSAGVRPNIELAQKAGLLCRRGVVVNDRLETSDPDIYAVGDVAEFNGHVWGIIPAALAQARVAAAQIAGQSEHIYEDIVPSTTLRVTGIELTSIGEVNPGGEGFVQVRFSDPERGIYKKLVLREGRVVGAILLGDNTDLRAVNMLIDRGIDVSTYQDKLWNEGFLQELVRGGSG
ncbi:MAG: NAD(P)/FAD-dependent oxidoreductase [Chloroflexi bacterium]|nr:NAD(P)/FAD-dependent oxidoreductase [Chloroflexota bacterium]